MISRLRATTLGLPRGLGRVWQWIRSHCGRRRQAWTDDIGPSPSPLTRLSGGWRRFARYLLIAAGILLFVGLQVAVGYEITASNYFLVIVLMAGGIYAAILFASPLAAMLIWIVVSPISTYVLATHDPSGMNFVTFDTVTFFLLFVALAVRTLANRQKIRWPHAGELALISFVLYVLLSIFIRQEMSLNQLKWFMLRIGVWPFIFYYAKSTARSKEDIGKYLTAFLVGTLVVGLSMIYEHFAGKSIYSVIFGISIPLSWSDIGSGRATGPFRTPIHGPQLLIPAVFFGVSLLWCSRSAWRRVLIASAVAAGILGVLYTYTRNNYIMLTAFLLLMPILAVRQRKLYAGLLTTALVLVVAAYPVIRTGDLHTRLTKDTASSRILFMRTSMEIIKDHLWFGVGWGNSLAATKEYIVSRAQYEGSSSRKALGVSKLGIPTLVHNTYLQITQENGVIGALLFYSAVLLMLLRIWRVYLRAPADGPLGKSFVAVVGIYVIAWLMATMAFSNDIADYANALLWIYLALASRYGEILSSEPSAGAPDTGIPEEARSHA